MKFKQKLIYFALGCAFVVIGQVLVTVLTPKVTAQGKKADAEFDTVKVRSLQVVDKEGKVLAIMGINVNHGGVLQLYGNNGKMEALIGAIGKGGIVSVQDNDDVRVSMYVHTYGGFIDIFGNDGKRRAAIGINEYGHGGINTWDKNGYRLR